MGHLSCLVLKKIDINGFSCDIFLYNKDEKIIKNYRMGIKK